MNHRITKIQNDFSWKKLCCSYNQSRNIQMFFEMILGLPPYWKGNRESTPHWITECQEGSLLYWFKEALSKIGGQQANLEWNLSLSSNTLLRNSWSSALQNQTKQKQKIWYVSACSELQGHGQDT